MADTYPNGLYIPGGLPPPQLPNGLNVPPDLPHPDVTLAGGGAYGQGIPGSSLTSPVNQGNSVGDWTPVQGVDISGVKLPSDLPPPLPQRSVSVQLPPPIPGYPMSAFMPSDSGVPMGVSPEPANASLGSRIVGKTIMAAGMTPIEIAINALQAPEMAQRAIVQAGAYKPGVTEPPVEIPAQTALGLAGARIAGAPEAGMTLGVGPSGKLPGGLEPPPDLPTPPPLEGEIIPPKYSAAQTRAEEDVKARQQATAVTPATPEEHIASITGREPPTVVRDKQVPYLAGSSNDGSTVYVDPRVPDKLSIKAADGTGNVSIDPAHPLAVHEGVEHELMTRQGMPYETAHRQALVEEQKVVQQLGGDWQSYQDKMHTLAEQTEKQPINQKDLPSDLYAKPYAHTDLYPKVEAAETPTAAPTVTQGIAAGNRGGEAGPPAQPPGGGTPPPGPSAAAAGPPPERGSLARRIFSPATATAEGAKAAGEIRRGTGLAAQATEQARSALEPYYKDINKASDAARNRTVAYIEDRKLSPDTLPPRLRQFADTWRDVALGRRQMLEDLPSTSKMGFVEDYFPHLWEDPKAAARFVDEWQQRLGTKEGSGRATKERTIPTVAEGIAAGLKPKLDVMGTVMNYVENMDRFIAHNSIFDRALQNGDVGYYGAGKQPTGWVKVNGRLGQKGMLQAYAPEGWARVYNNYVSRGIHEISPDLGELYDKLRYGSNALTAFKLGLNGYHFLTELEAGLSHSFARGIDEMVGGHPLMSARSFGQGLVSPVRGAIVGKRLQDVYLGKKDGTPLDRQIARIMAEAGGRAVGTRHAPDYAMSRLGSYFTAFKRGALRAGFEADAADMMRNPLLGPTKVVGRHIGRVMQTIAQPLFEKYIPAIKTAAVRDDIASWMDRHPDATHEETVAAARGIVDRVDDRFGEMIQDNVFLPKVIKQAGTLGLLSWSYRFGQLGRALGVGVAHTIGAPFRAAKQAMGYQTRQPIWTPQMSYLLGATMTYAMLAAVYQYIKTGEAPKDTTDLMAPRTGGFDQHGRPERLIMPGPAKDVFRAYHDPLGELTGGLNPALQVAGQSATIGHGQGGQDWAGNRILSPPKPGQSWLSNVPDWLRQYMGFVMQSIGPISVENLAQQPSPKTGLSAPERFIGVRQAPAYMSGQGYNLDVPHSKRQAIQMMLQQQRSQKNQAGYPSWMRYGGTQ